MIKRHEYTFTSELSGRVDAVCSKQLGISRTAFSFDSLICTVNGKSAKKSQKVNEGDEIKISYEEEILEGLEAENLDLDILYEDDEILVINKAQGMAVHPGAGNFRGTVANALLGLYGEDFEAGDDDLRPGIVHRLDKDTSGVMVIAKTQNAHQMLSKMFSEHENKKCYLAIVKGEFNLPSGVIDSRIVRDRKNRKKYTTTENITEGRDALTKYTVLSQNNGYALVKVRIFTGRTHQIRVHMTSIGHPILGDPIYGRKDSLYPDATLMLHSYKLGIIHPESGKAETFKAPLPAHFTKALSDLGLSFEEV